MGVRPPAAGRRARPAQRRGGRARPPRARPAHRGRAALPEGVALLQFDRTELRRFLWHSYLVVPEGQELQHLDCDRALAELLA
ncbi:hypothetical protein ACFQ2M_16170 [Kitasatospora saccharophila]|uniref:hypothetical protein n=1 Tax=Kitasatospora saccharophila TaxID=407973 RepID=UPI00362BD406